MKTYDKLDNRYIFTGTITTSEAMHIGSGKGDERTDSTFVQNNGKYYIPGSSLRGAFRSTVERIVASLGGYTCLLSKEEGVKCITVCDVTQNEYKKEVKDGKSDLELAKWLSEGYRLCSTCKVFGSTHFASKVKFIDLPLKESEERKPHGIVRSGIKIDRDTETASDGALFDFEVVEKGFKYQFELISENLEEDDFGILALGLNELLKGNIYIGARSSVGLGKCRLNSDLLIQYFDNTQEYTLKEYLVGNELGTLELDWINEKINKYFSKPEEEMV